MNEADRYLQSQIDPMLTPGEQVLHFAYVRRQPSFLLQVLLLLTIVGAVVLLVMTTPYYAVLTNRRLILVRTKMTFWTGSPKLVNLGVEQYDVRQIQQVATGGVANNRSMTFRMVDGSEQTLRISPWFKQVSGTAAFFEQVPGLVGSGQLRQLAGG